MTRWWRRSTSPAPPSRSSGATATIDLPPLLDSTAYYVEVEAGAFADLAGNAFAGISGPTAWNFTTRGVLVVTEFSATASGFTARFSARCGPGVLEPVRRLGPHAGRSRRDAGGQPRPASSAGRWWSATATGGSRSSAPAGRCRRTPTPSRSAVPTTDSRTPAASCWTGTATGRRATTTRRRSPSARSPADEVVVGIADFARGYGQPVNLPRNTDAGIPLTLSTGQNVSRVVAASWSTTPAC